jgi:DNA (cytosine-5)-methyltransferase 1
MKKDNPTYVSLFSSAGVGCYGFKLENFECIVTCDINKKRMQIQKYNNVCKCDERYIIGDITQDETKEKILNKIAEWQKKRTKCIDVIIATPPCQGMSIANHKKKNETQRNSLVVESIKIVNSIKPKFFVFENVRSFLKTTCTDVDGVNKTIENTIDLNLAGDYNILSKTINFKDYGIPSSRTRTLVIGVRKDLRDVAPHIIFPTKEEQITLREIIGDMPKLNVMGEISSRDIYHWFRPYKQNMRDWIADLKEGQSAFENKDATKQPHKKINGKIIYNTNKNGDKYSRCYWDKVAPCIHTRNDILASQSTIHPRDDRVFSIRELMKMMTIPDSFMWSDIPVTKLNNLTELEKRKFLRKNELTIRQAIGEAVPTKIFKTIASKINIAINQSI